MTGAVTRSCSVKKGVLKNFAKFTGKHLCQGLFFNKVAGLNHYLLLLKKVYPSTLVALFLGGAMQIKIYWYTESLTFFISFFKCCLSGSEPSCPPDVKTSLKITWWVTLVLSVCPPWISVELIIYAGRRTSIF